MKILLMLLSGCAAMWAQGTVTIFGTVTDTSGSVAPEVAVKVLHTTTGATRQAQSDVRGDYVFTQLSVGVYTISAEATGFKRFVSPDIVMQVDENRRVPIVLQVGAMTDSVTVLAEAAQVETRSGVIKEVIDSKRIEELPLNGRNPLDLQLLVPGSGAVLGGDQAQNNFIAVNGTRTNANNYTLDGGDNHDPQFNSASVFPNPDALEEFAIQTNSYSAEFGRNAGIQVNAISKSGTNQLHGSLFEFLRNEKLNARNFFATTVPPFKRNQFGGSFGGPVLIPRLYNGKDRTFLFFAWQSTRSNSSPSVITAPVPSGAKRLGVFPTSIRDPQNANQPFVNNTVPASRISPIATRFLTQFVPLANSPSGLYVFASPVVFNQDQALVKVDHQISSNNRVSTRYLKSWELNQQTVNNLPGWYAPIYYTNDNVTSTDTHIFTPASLNVFTFTYNDIGRSQMPHVPGNTFLSDLGAGITKPFTRTDITASMNLSVSGYFQGWARYPLLHFRNNLQFSDKVNLNRATHLFKFGVDYRRSALDVGEFPSDCTCSFNGSFTGDAMADFLIDRPITFGQSSPAYDKVQLHELGLFAQDDWRVSSRLTMNLGARWEPYIPYRDQNNSVEYVRVGAQSSVIPGAPPGLLFVGDAGITNTFVSARWAKLAPRFGFALDPEGKGRMSIRGGYGFFFSNARSEGTLGQTRNQPYSIGLSINSPPGGMANPYATLSGGNPFPYAPPSTPEQLRNSKFVLPMGVAEWNPNFTTANIQQWNFNVQREFFGSYVFTAAYVGSKGNHLQIVYDTNPAVYVPGSSTTGNQDARRSLAPYFQNINSISSDSNSTYHSMQLSLNKRFTHNFTVLASYTWGKTIDDSSATPTSEGATRNPRNLRMNRGVSNFDVPQRFVASYIWDLPKFQRQPGLLRQIIGGWETNGIVILQDGYPLSVTAGQDRSLVAANSDYADVIGNPYLDPKLPRGVLINQYFNTTAFALPPLGTFGSAARGILRGPGQATVNFGVFKSFHMVENHQLQFRAEFFNLFNRVNLGNPAVSLSNANTFGKITTAGDPRVIQFAMRYHF